MRERLIGKTCFVTGGAQGIGRAIAERFAAEGARVIAADLRFGADAPRAPGISLLQLDVTVEAAVAAAAAAYPEVSVLVNCVGHVATGNLLDCSMAEFDRSMDINVRSMVLTTRAFLPAMLARRAGAIINIASVVSTVMTAPERFAYATSKAAVIGLTASVARGLRRAPADGAPGSAGGNRGGRGAAGIKRSGLHDRHQPHHRWRHELMNRAPGPTPG